VFNKRFVLFCSLVAVCFSACQEEGPAPLSTQEIIRKVNTRCPVMIDSETRLEYLRALPDPGIQYTYRLVHLSQIEDTVAFRNLLWPGLLAAMRSDPELQSLRDKAYTIVHRYEAADGHYLLSIRILPADYKTP
jgi:hypothetical protein